MLNMSTTQRPNVYHDLRESNPTLHPLYSNCLKTDASPHLAARHETSTKPAHLTAEARRQPSSIPIVKALADSHVVRPGGGASETDVKRAARSGFSSDTPSSRQSPHTEHLGRPNRQMHTVNSRRLPEEFGAASYPNTPTLRPRHSTLLSARPYSSYTLGARPVSAFIDESRQVTGFLESSLPISARPPPMPSRPVKTMSIVELEQRHRIALQRLQQPANVRIAQDGHPTIPATTTPSMKGRAKPSRVTEILRHDDESLSRKSAAGVKVVERRGSANEVPMVEVPESKKPRRWGIFRLFGSRATSPHSPPPPSSKASRKARNNKSDLPVLTISGDSISDGVDGNLDDDSDSDVPLAQLRPILRARTSTMTVRSSPSGTDLRGIRNDSNPTPFMRDNLTAPVSLHRISMMSIAPQPERPHGKTRGHMIVPPGHAASTTAASKQRNRSSTWLTY